MARVELRGISKEYEGGVQAVSEANFTVEDQEFVILVGPSGCGKSTTLRMVAGLEDITEGELYIDGELMNDVPPKDRNIAMVFQNFGLYPHMSVYDNMSFGLQIRKVEKPEIHRRVYEAARILDIEQYLYRKPNALSGGQRQRVAVGRAIVRNPKVFLFDEPLSNLDAKLRVQMRAELADLHTRLDATMIYVTHDQVEAMTMADKIVVMKDGKIQQVGSALDVYDYPVNKFVASFIGSPPMNFLIVQVEEKNGKIVLNGASFELNPAAEHLPWLKKYLGKHICFGIRPEDLVFFRRPQPENTIGIKIAMIEPLGAETHLWLTTTTQTLVARVQHRYNFRVGDTGNFVPSMERARYFNLETERSILEEPDAAG
ncbi:MAG: sn-glycerol-3-phosphate ABC transporter ATP-binding protein UgpC [Spirochaetaceae bacterium]|jgi:multiple sugar transport system ATP-binding protein|nr:sn-glycerol-3-phosphate ABC transporter ATP-binding protein UgpC [Spirochaetaceae bacterium]